MRLAIFIHKNIERIVQEWEECARTIQPQHHSMSSVELLDHAKELLEEIAAALPGGHGAETIESSSGPEPGSNADNAAQIYAQRRVESGLNIDQLVAEYRALRTNVLRLWSQREKTATWFEVEDMTKFNELIDKALADSIARYSFLAKRSQDIFLGILGHDLKTPLQALSLGAEYLMRSTPADSNLLQLGSRMLNSTARMTEIVDNLLDFTKIRVGGGLRIMRKPGDLRTICEQVVEELRFCHPGRIITAEFIGDVSGEWDVGRIGQIYQNLIANALEHGSQEGSVQVKTQARGDEVEISVHNEGNPIPLAEQVNIFDPLRRSLGKDGEEAPNRKNLGLGLYVVREITTAHHGTIDIYSGGEGTTFTIRLPRHSPIPLDSRFVSLDQTETAPV